MKRSQLLVLLFLCFASAQLFSQKKGDDDTNAKIKAIFIYNFTKYIEWPDLKEIETFKIGVYDNSKLLGELQKMTNVKKVRDVMIEVVELKSLKEIDESYKILILNSKKKFPLGSIYSAIGDKPILAVTDGYNEDQVMIDFRIDRVDGKVRQRFALNRKEIRKQGLKVSSTLEKLATPIESTWSYSRNSDSSTLNTEKEEPKGTARAIDHKEAAERKAATPAISNEKYDAIIAQMRAELESDKEVIQNQGQEISSLKSNISELQTTILLKENELDIVKQQIELQSEKLSKISDSTIQKAKELQSNIEKAKEALGNLQEIKAELKESKAILESQKTINTVTIIVLIIIAILGAIAYRNYRTQKTQAAVIREQMIIAEKQRDEIHTQHLELEEKNREITDSITYAKRIQEAILPPLKLVQTNLENSFIFYLPKDIVAGDFYWMEPQKDRVIFAAADCTGHGVPGAMVSVVCSNALNRAVREFQLTKPSEILDKTLDIVIERFEKSEEDVKDGMDIALCSYQTEKRLLNYAGAHNPLWIIRKNATEVEEIKANKQPIGKYAEKKPFINHEIQLQEGDTVYLFSDGYVDQFGGERGKKFKTVNFKKLLLSVQEKDIAEQYAIIKQIFQDWKADVEQLDDVCVIGFRA